MSIPRRDPPRTSGHSGRPLSCSSERPRPGATPVILLARGAFAATAPSPLAAARHPRIRCRSTSCGVETSRSPRPLPFGQLRRPPDSRPARLAPARRPPDRSAFRGRSRGAVGGRRAHGASRARQSARKIWPHPFARLRMPPDRLAAALAQLRMPPDRSPDPLPGRPKAPGQRAGPEIRRASPGRRISPWRPTGRACPGRARCRAGGAPRPPPSDPAPTPRWARSGRARGAASSRAGAGTPA